MSFTTTSVTSARNHHGFSNIADQLLGSSEINADEIKNYESYAAIYSKRHDLIHGAVCDKLQIRWGEKTVDSIMMNERKFDTTSDYYTEVKNQTPDYMEVKGNSISIIEITVSVDLNAKNRKAAKYALLCQVLKSAGYIIDYKIFVFDPRNIYMNRDELIAHGLDDLVLDFASLICKNAKSLLALVHKTTHGSIFYNQFFEISERIQEVPITFDDVLKTHRSLPNKCFHSEKDLEKLFSRKIDHDVNESDSKFLKSILEKAKEIDNPLQYKEKFEEKNFLDTMIKLSNTEKVRSCLPVCYLETSSIDSAERSTTDDLYLVHMIASKMEDCGSSVMSTIGRSCRQHLDELMKKSEIKNEDFLFRCKLSDQDKSDVALDGPNRKKYVRAGSIPHIEATNYHDGYSLNPLVNVDDIETISFFFSQKDHINATGDIMMDMKLLSEASGTGLNYLKLCQNIYREININAMRGDRRHSYIIKPTGSKGVFICLYPGTKLRCGELANIVWFKILIDNELAHTRPPVSTTRLFKKTVWDNKISHSRWLSCDVHRLDHYIRCYDKILMAYLAFLSQKYRSSEELVKKFQKKKTDESDKDTDEPLNPIDYNLIKYYNEDTTNTLGLITMIYLEDRRSTSKMLQNVRYLVMTSISLYPKYSSVMEKFNEAIRSPLQLYLLKKSLQYIVKMDQWRASTNSRFGPVQYDHKSHTFLDMYGGSIIMLPRPLVSGDSIYAEFSEILSEMYMTMLFNKNQDDPTHASFQILDKIIEGEENFIKVKADGDHLGYKPNKTDSKFARSIIDFPSTHKFSRRAIEIASKLLREELDDPSGEHYRTSISKGNINKTIDEYATFKSSADNKPTTYNPQDDRNGKRVRCLTGVTKLLEQGLNTTLDVVSKYKDEETYYHVFKKNQIGGVREILILPITNRIRINLLETISRNLCSFDKREILTHGVTKYDSIKALLYTSKKYGGVRTPIHLTFDKSKWGPSFVPIQFLYLFSSFRDKLGSYYNFVVDILIRHQNKKCVLPERLVRAWHNDHDNKYTHRFPGLQKLKKRFEMDKQMTYDNESNMGQGILHYTSSLLHLAMITMRNRLYKMWCEDEMLDSNDHEDLLSSDDSYTLFCPELISKDYTVKKLTMFLKCQRVVELLFNCRTSSVKSSINPLIGEFNSLFLSNMTFIPTLIKYCLSSVHPANTDSFFRMVKESYGSSRQIVENGGGLDLYLVSSYMNKRYCETIYHTNVGGHNNLSKLGLNTIPYHLGHFPIFNPSLMVMLGPEYYNYKLYKKEWDTLNDLEKKLFCSSHKIIKGDLISMMSEFEEGDTMLGGIMRIEALMGPVKQLERLRRESLLTKEQLEDMVIEDPLLIIRKPRNPDEIKFKVSHKLYTTGSKEALKNLACSIFYGRVSATVSANVFTIPGATDDEGKPIKMTYLESLQQLLHKESEIQNLDQHIKFLYPKYVDYDIFLNNDDFRMSYIVRNPFEIQTVQKLVTHKIYTKLTQPVPELLSYNWGVKPVPEHLATKVDRDMILMKMHFPLIKSSIEETMNQFSGSQSDKVKSMLMLILKLFSLKDRSFKGVIYGFGSSDITRAYETLIERNISNSLSAEIATSVPFIRSTAIADKIYCAHNQTILSSLNNCQPRSMWEMITQEELSIFFQDQILNETIKKRVFLVAVSLGMIENVERWSGKVGIILHYWNKKQKNSNGVYYGDFDLLLVMGSLRLNITYNSRQDHYTIYKQGAFDPIILYNFFKEIFNILDITIEDITKRTGPGPWMLIDDKILKTNGVGFQMFDSINIDEIIFEKCDLKIDHDWTRLVDSSGYRLYNIETGLLSTNYVPSKEYDFRCFNLSFVRLCSLRSFSQNFNVQYKSRKEILDSLDDLVVDKPELLYITKKKLNLPDDWAERIEEKTEESIILEDDTDYTSILMNIDPIMPPNMSMEDEGIADMIQFLGKTDAIFSMKTVQKIHNSRSLLLNIKNIKYTMITRMILSDSRINRVAIVSAANLLTNGSKKYILQSLISFYDRTYRSTEVGSPEGVFLDIDGDLIKKFNIILQDMSINFD